MHIMEKRHCVTLMDVVSKAHLPAAPQAVIFRPIYLLTKLLF